MAKGKGEKKKSGKKQKDRGKVDAAELTGKAAKKARKKEAKAEKARQAEAVAASSWSDLLRVGAGFELAVVEPASTPGFVGDEKDADAVMAGLQKRLADLQERLFAESKGGGTRSVLLVIQGMDTSGKGGIMRHVVGAVDPQGIRITAFKAPSAEERRHPFLWRIRRALPTPGHIGVFDRSHYEDVLIVRVHELVPPTTWSRRYGQINRFEEGVVAGGTTVVKVMLHLSPAEQKALSECAIVGRDEQRKVSRALSDKSFADLKAKGMAVNEIAPAEQKRLRDAVKPVYDKHATTIGKETVDRMNAALTKIRGS
jgi:hypothetical protein